MFRLRWELLRLQLKLFAYNVTVCLSTSTDYEQKSSTASKQAPNVSRKVFPNSHMIFSRPFLRRDFEVVVIMTIIAISQHSHCHCRHHHHHHHHCCCRHRRQHFQAIALRNCGKERRRFFPRALVILLVCADDLHRLLLKEDICEEACLNLLG